MQSVYARAVTYVALMAVCAGCLPRATSPPLTAPQPTFDVARFFDGRTDGRGTLTMRFGADRAVIVQSIGTTAADGSFRLDQTIKVGNDAPSSRTWISRQADSQQLSISLSEADGAVNAESRGNLLHLRYRMRFAVYMEQWLYLRPDGRSVDNRAQITVLGIPWARLSETILRADAPR